MNYIDIVLFLLIVCAGASISEAETKISRLQQRIKELERRHQ